MSRDCTDPRVSVSNRLRDPISRLNMLSFANDTDCALGILILINHTISKRSSHFLKCLLLSLGEVEVCNRQEERRACYEDVVIVFVNIGKSTGSSLGD